MVESNAVQVISVDSPDLVPPLTGPIAALLQHLVAGGVAVGDRRYDKLFYALDLRQRSTDG
ncbi:hypothetical protein [Mycolicibacterium peregrinum]|uniref:hypothetical protein n=1 Tax=Mycolicibacterium peregrinum TaxID=43304 RepID=UPI003AAB1265